MKHELLPAILPTSFSELTEKINLVCGAVDTVQIDFCDGRFVPSKTWPFLKEPTTDNVQPTAQEEKRERYGFEELITEGNGLPCRDRLDFEAHLMIEDPGMILSDMVKIGFSRILLHLETVSSDILSGLIHEWKGVVEIGVALSADTPLEELAPFAHEIQSVQLMSIKEIGAQGQTFASGVFERISTLRKQYPNHILSVDGGVTLQNAEALVLAGINRLVVGSAIFGSPDIPNTIAQFKDLLY